MAGKSHNGPIHYGLLQKEWILPKNCNYLLLYINKLKLSNCNKNMWIFQVTIFGHSAEATSVAIHITSQNHWLYFEVQLFKPLLQLTSENVGWSESPRAKFSLMLECSNLECMRSKSPWAILEAQQKTNSQPGIVLQRLRP